METSILRKRLNTFKSSKGSLRAISNDVILEVLRGWESWPGSSADFYRELEITKGQLAVIIKKAKSLVKKGIIVESEFMEIPNPSEIASSSASDGACCIEITWKGGNVIRFGQVDQLIQFLNKVA